MMSLLCLVGLICLVLQSNQAERDKENSKKFGTELGIVPIPVDLEDMRKACLQ